MLETAALLDHLDFEGEQLARAAAAAGLGTAVPGLDWTVEQLVRHTGGVHRFVDDLIRGRIASLDERGDDDPGPDEVSQLMRWYADGRRALARALRDASPELDVPTFLRGVQPRRFWARRQAHETGIHRADAERAAGVDTVFDVDFAQDGIEEMLLGFGRGRPFAVPAGGTVALAAADGPSWVITFGAERNESVQTDAPAADAVVRGSSSDLYLWLWNRPAAVVVDGEPAVAARWAATVRIRRD